MGEESPNKLKEVLNEDHSIKLLKIQGGQRGDAFQKLNFFIKFVFPDEKCQLRLNSSEKLSDT